MNILDTDYVDTASALELEAIADTVLTEMEELIMEVFDITDFIDILTTK